MTGLPSSMISTAQMPQAPVAVPFDDMAVAGQALQGAGFTVYGHVMQGTGHGIAPDGLSVALAFVREVLAED